MAKTLGEIIHEHSFRTKRKVYLIERRYNVLALKALRDVGLDKSHKWVQFHRESLSYLRHQYYCE